VISVNADVVGVKLVTVLQVVSRRYEEKVHQELTTPNFHFRRPTFRIEHHVLCGVVSVLPRHVLVLWAVDEVMDTREASRPFRIRFEHDSEELSDR
jgi:hypothetical protein